MKTSHTLPVSRKFLERMHTRVTDVMTKLGRASSGSIDDVLQLITHYLDTREVPEIIPGPTAISLIVFFSLKEEIDAAIMRSQRARERAILRKRSSFPAQRRDKAMLVPVNDSVQPHHASKQPSSIFPPMVSSTPSPHSTSSLQHPSSPLPTISLRE